MGTNYYVETPGCENACDHCAQAGRVHLGKSSHGWRFTHRAYRGEHRPPAVTWPVDGRESWLKLLDLGPIIDEYGRVQDRREFLEFIDSKQDGIARDSARGRELGGPGWRPRPGDFVSDGYDFLDEEFS